jgi:DNA-binding CsgD family transcriptional regulator
MAGLTKSTIASSDWYAALARIWDGQFTAAVALGLVEELIERLDIDSALILRYPRAAPPQLLYGRADHKHRANKIDDYLLGHYALDPFYLRIEHCSRQGLIALRDVIEEDFASSQYYDVHYRSAGLIDEMCFCCEDGEEGHLSLSLSRAIDKPFFTQGELDAAQALAPLVNAVMRATWRQLSPQEMQVADASSGDHHRRIESARANFGRSVLTDREFEILQYLLRGKSVDFIAQRLDIAVSTVKVHRKHIYSKLNINSQAEIFTLFLEAVAASRHESSDADPLASYRARSEN